MNTHIDTIAEWWENAGKGEAEPGDWIITHGLDDTNPAYIIEQAPRYPLSSKRQPYRILARAPKPKPAWHDADMVLAFARAYPSDYGERRSVYYRCADGRFSGSNDQRRYKPEDLRDVTPLIEAKVTASAMRAVDALLAHHGMPTSEATATAVTRAALGLEAE